MHDRGSVWHAVRASTAIPAIFPPLLADDYEALVDGSVMRATEANSANRMRQSTFRGIADLLIEAPLGEFAILAFDRNAPITAIG